MKYNITVSKSLKYIENNISELITAEDIAKEAGYSLYYFSRIFKKQMGLSIMEYVKERRLIKASEEICNGKKIIDAALDYGYQSHSSFTKSFTKKFGFSPVLLRAFSFQINCLQGGNYNMSHVFIKNTNIDSPKEELYEILIKTIKVNKLEFDLEKINRAYLFACKEHDGEKRYSGQEYVTHSINVAIILADIGADEDTVIGGLLHDTISGKSEEKINFFEKQFSKRILQIITDAKIINKESSAKDEDVIMLALADRLHNMRTIEFINENEWKQKAKETIDIFSPIAVSLNNKKICAELNNLSLKYI